MHSICLPAPDQEFGGIVAIALGWGMFQPRRKWTTEHGQSKQLRYVGLRVSDKKYKHFKMFGTETSSNQTWNIKELCEGDSGKNRASSL